MSSSVTIFTEAGADYGYGHLMRCLALAQGFREKGLSVSFLIRGDGDFSTLLSGFPFRIMEWLDINVIKKHKQNSDIVVVDSYHSDEGLCKNLYALYKKVLFLDDYNRIPYPGGWILNGVIGAERISYPANENACYLLGPSYQPLRREFWDVPEYTVRQEIEKVLITFGGSDITNETPGVLENLCRYYPDWEKTVILGAGFINSTAIRTIADSNTVLVEHATALWMRQEMVAADLCISAAGQTISELARVGVPTLGVQVAENQNNNVKNWQHSGFLNMFDVWPIDNAFLQYENRKRRSLIGRSIIDGQGVRRVVERVISTELEKKSVSRSYANGCD